MRAAVDAAHAAQADPVTEPIPRLRSAAAFDLVLHQAEDEPGSLWTPAARRIAEPADATPRLNGSPRQQPARTASSGVAAHLGRLRRTRPAFSMLRLWR
jgi:hypothetical protein